MTERNNDGVKVSRRIVLAGIAAGLAPTAARKALAQSAPGAVSEKGAPTEKGAAIWLDMDQKQLDDAYDQTKYAPNPKQITDRYESNSKAMRARVGEPKRFNYGPTPIERLEVYAAKRPNAPMLPAARRPEPSKAVTQSGACPGMTHTGATTERSPTVRRFSHHRLGRRLKGRRNGQPQWNRARSERVTETAQQRDRSGSQ